MEEIYNKILNNLEKSKEYKSDIYFSIIMPVYNTEKYLKRCLDSVLNQSFKNMEIIIVNDCSPGNCEEIILSYKDERIRYIKNEQNLGSAWSRINGLSHAKGKYIHFIDSDDMLVEESYSKINKYLKNKYDVLYFNGYNFYDDHIEESEYYLVKDYKLYGKRAAFDDMFFTDKMLRPLWARVFKRLVAIEGAKYMPKDYTCVADDWIFNLFILFHAKSYRSVSDILYYYYQENPNAITAIVENKKEHNIDFNKINRNLKQAYISYNAVSEFLKAKNVWNIYRHYWMLYIIRDLRYSFIGPFQNFDGYFEYLFNKDKNKYVEESLEYFHSNISNLNVLNFVYKQLLDSSGVMEEKSFKYALRSQLYRFFSSIIRIRNYPQALFNISITKSNEYKRMHIRFLFFKLTVKLKPNQSIK
ncbi:glycosyltransferase family 2 protein [Brachyspira intermedia]|uniref:glycosyltransferase family 2 protein n=1 Tax=Brachyspira intermedia TaxID=84377 RepID=UPI003006F369